jgi:hypothetical protein
MDGFATDTLGRSNERGGILGSKFLSRREGAAVAEGGEVMAARAESAGEGVGLDEAAERWGSSKALKSGSENLIARAAHQVKVNVYVCSAFLVVVDSEAECESANKMKRSRLRLSFLCDKYAGADEAA